MTTKYKRDINRAYLVIEEQILYEEDYQMPMLKKNHIPGILEIEGHGIDEKSQYSYNVSGKTSMKSFFEKRKLDREDMEQFILQLVKLTKLLQNFLLDPNKLLLDAEYIFTEKNQWYFCYLPVAEKSLCQSFHELTEYFVSQVNYEKKEGIHLAYELHKATMQENYDIEKIMEEYEVMEQEQALAIDQLEERGNIFSLDEGEEDEEGEPLYYEDVQTLREVGGIWESLRHTFHRKKQPKWGEWEEELPWEDQFPR
ncbi:MAG: DUF6382 domain-containing protein [Hespellia sp.]|nr:DUF6382 domain-containing protein [Hespellia sp.]